MSAPKHTRPERYAGSSFSAADVQAIRPEMSDDEAADFLEENAKYIAEAMVEAGWDAIRALLPINDEKNTVTCSVCEKEVADNESHSGPNGEGSICNDCTTE